MAKCPHKLGSVLVYDPVFLDKIIGKNTAGILAGTKMKVIQPSNCPRNGTRGMCYTEIADTKKFVGLVCVNSLISEEDWKKRQLPATDTSV